MGRPLAILHAFSGFADPFPAKTLAAIDRNGSIPLLDWHCGSLAEINAGKHDGLIHAYAKGVRAFGKPLFLRWYWEMNLDKHKAKSCDAFGAGPAFVAAWRRIRTIFSAEGATNAAFVWCPSGHGDVTPYYPGDAYVDWVAADKFDRMAQGEAAFATMFGRFLATLPTHGKPFMVGATGAPAADQAAFIRGIARDAPKFPQIKAIMYFDAPGKHGFQLQGEGLAAFRALAADPYFTRRALRGARSHTEDRSRSAQLAQEGEGVAARRCRLPGDWPASHCSTAGAGDGRMISDTTFVSSRIIDRKGRRLADRLAGQGVPVQRHRSP